MKYPKHPRWDSIGWEPFNRAVSSKFTKSKFPTYAPRGSDGRFKPKTNSIGVKSSGKGARPIGVVTHAGENSDEPPPPESPTPRYVYLNVLYNTGVFAWPLNADEGLAQALVGTQGTEVPQAWKMFTPEAACDNCSTVTQTKVCTKPMTGSKQHDLPGYVMAQAGIFIASPVAAKTTWPSTIWLKNSEKQSHSMSVEL